MIHTVYHVQLIYIQNTIFKKEELTYCFLPEISFSLEGAYPAEKDVSP